MTNKYMKKCSISLAIKEMKIKMTLRFHHWRGHGFLAPSLVRASFLLLLVITELTGLNWE
jgi:hypothetical protein